MHEGADSTAGARETSMFQDADISRLVHMFIKMVATYIGALIIEAVLVGVGWGMGAWSCTFVTAVTITATVFLAILLAGLLFFGLGLFTAPFVLWIRAVLHLAYFIWGIVALATHDCVGAQPIVLDIFSALGAGLLWIPL